jgi:hypothetical protein
MRSRLDSNRRRIQDYRFALVQASGIRGRTVPVSALEIKPVSEASRSSPGEDMTIHVDDIHPPASALLGLVNGLDVCQEAHP